MRSERTSRQSRLPEVGDAGQARLDAAVLRVARAEGADVERVYLEGAGCGTEDGARHVPPFPHAQAFHHRAPQAVAAGAWRALMQIHAVLELGALAEGGHGSAR